MTRSNSPLFVSHSCKVPSSQPLSKPRLSGVKARPYTTALWPCSTARVLLFSTSHSRIVRSRPPLASSHPSGLQAREPTGTGCGKFSSLSPSFASQIRPVAFIPQLASRLPSEENARQRIPCVCQPDQSKDTCPPDRVLLARPHT